MSSILIVEDEVVIRSALRRLLERNRYEVSEAGSVSEALENHHLPTFDIIISDLRLPGAPGTDIIAQAGDVPVLIMTSYASVKSAVESMKIGAVDYIAKPFDHDEMVLTIERALKQSRLQHQNEALRSELQRHHPVDGLIGECAPMQALRKRIHKIAPTDATVMVLGESGTGKELVARALQANSLRADAPLITMNCAAIPEGLIESELFGHERGAFTGATETRRGLIESADGGTLFLDEIGELSLPTQARLLRVLQEGDIRRVGASHDRKVDVRLIAATHRDLQQQVAEGLFREDLYFRLNVMEVHLPALRERQEDIPMLADFLLNKVGNRLNRHDLNFTPAALQIMLDYRWPGNVRELENAIERAAILCEGDQITPDLLAINAQQPTKATSQPTESATNLSLEEYFRQFVLEHQGQMTETALAKHLGISRKALWERRQRFGIPRKKG